LSRRPGRYTGITFTLARQKLGQHFLVSGKALERIAHAACGESVSLAVEIGPGKGALTELLLTRAEHVVAIELDPELARHLNGRWFKDPRIEILEANALHVDWSSWGPGVLVGNLPYYIATALITRYLRDPGLLRLGVFLIQKEVAERIVAKPGTRDYGYLSVECQFLADVEYLYTVPPGAFRPPPQVDSGVIRVTPRPRDTAHESFTTESFTKGFLAFASACFRQKRKTLRNNLNALYDREVLSGMPELGIRAEELSVAQFTDLYLKLAPHLKPAPHAEPEPLWPDEIPPPPEADR
jgi:16S rRNA (adenine1518-N6/adenine1519-N6)-dimethyltransferase